MSIQTLAPRHAAPRVWPGLTVQDDCDRCGHSDGVRITQARVRVAKDDLVLTFCGHHYARYELALLQAGFVLVTDQRHELTVKPGVSAA